MSNNTLAGFVGGLALAIAGFVGFSLTDDGGNPNVTVIITPTPIVAPSPSELACRAGWTEIQRSVTHTDGAANGPVDIGYISCDRDGYTYTQTLGGSPVYRDLKTGNEVTEAEALR